MKVAVPLFLLAVSGAFNIFFVVGMAMKPHPPMKPHGPERRADFFTRELELDEEQKEAFLRVDREFHSERMRRGEEHKGHFEKALSELVKDEPDEAVLTKFIESEDPVNPRRHFVKHMRSIMKILRPDQRKKAAEIFRRGRGRGRMGGPRPGMGGGRKGGWSDRGPRGEGPGGRKGGR
ncbi:MAG: Spy/CpxP family protein refolding chaperone [Planctomycetota bacterium]|jgi:Spy/CpxP family protein refolding chaperone